MDFLSVEVIQDIKLRNYVDFVLLLKDNANEYFGSKRDESKTKTKTKVKEIDGILCWIRAFSVWAYVFVESHPWEAKGLFQYLTHILDRDRDYQWAAVYQYERDFRHAMENDPYLRIGPTDLGQWQWVTSKLKAKNKHLPPNDKPKFRQGDFCKQRHTQTENQHAMILMLELALVNLARVVSPTFAVTAEMIIQRFIVNMVLLAICMELETISCTILSKSVSVIGTVTVKYTDRAIVGSTVKLHMVEN